MRANPAGQIVSQPSNPAQTMRSRYSGAPVSGYGVRGNNMPVGVVNGNQVYNYGLSGAYGGYGGTFLADPGKTTAFSGRTAPTWLTGAGSDKQIGTNAPRATSAARGGAGAYGGAGVGGLFAGGGGSASAIGQQLQDDLNKANAANDARYNQALDTNQSGYGGIYGTINSGRDQQLGLVGGLGGSAHELQNRQTQQRLGQSQQSLYGRGLGNSTVVDSMAKGIQSEGDFQNRAIDEELARLKLGIYGHATDQMVGAQTGATGQRVGIIESRTDQGPNIASILNLLSHAGALNPGAGGAGVYGGSGAYGANGNAGGGEGFGLTRPGGDSGSGGNVNDANGGLSAQQPQNQPVRLPAPQMPEETIYGGNVTGQSPTNIEPLLPGEGQGQASGGSLADTARKALVDAGFPQAVGWNDDYAIQMAKLHVPQALA